MDGRAGERPVRAFRHRGHQTEGAQPVQRRQQKTAEWLTSSLSAARPGIRRQKPNIGAEVRALTIGNYLVLYRLAEQRVEIVRVVHGAREVSTLF
ncbi:MAG: type II toxin-antitoxin system RelE/ParE family toxin [Mesorhizobium sp.]|nr:MAG: type II toxin-antitoxin system RelE/ParE family toxin [Mesorhizobium sp.]RWO28255.1 MAG: type II toxin-antitoxin system RelE/ParE family toxin [Mesorhizobium sp.]RWO41022.1 MAG: type II toxin-antitoxin system RelE/ParE family toxin [Mesorhizobium sp.]RWO47327.1 MAG: type II toxin-antitoxin system RelE/ParE family toxin [Mesorhizobium sp.]RWQ02149.1 MAG: type II toxin-antitoxin system RelE/ParE family toxin [Mesorhizobium sp.]